MRLIDADALEENLTLLAKHEDDFRANVILGVVSTVRFAKTIDAVPVVRCKDCKNWMYEDDDSIDDVEYIYYDNYNTEDN